MEIYEIIKKSEIETIAGMQKHAQFLQSWEWKLFQESRGNVVTVFGIRSHKELIGYALCIYHKLPFAGYFYCPRGPLFVADVSEGEVREAYKALLFYLAAHAPKYQIIFLRIEPPETVIRKVFFDQLLAHTSLPHHKVRFVQPSDTTIVNLNQSEEQLMAGMHAKTRYNIRLAKKKGVVIKSFGSEGLDIFWDLSVQTAKRQGLRTYPKAYYKELLCGADKYFPTQVFVAEFQNTPLAAIIIGSYYKTATYLYGGTSDQFRNVMASHLLMWRAVLEARNNGMHYFDLYGIAPHYANEKHPLYNLTRFKKGFGGVEVNYLGAYECVFRPTLYIFYRLFRRIRAVLRS